MDDPHMTLVFNTSVVSLGALGCQTATLENQSHCLKNIILTI